MQLHSLYVQPSSNFDQYNIYLQRIKHCVESNLIKRYGQFPTHLQPSTQYLESSYMILEETLQDVPIDLVKLIHSYTTIEYFSMGSIYVVEGRLYLLVAAAQSICILQCLRQPIEQFVPNNFAFYITQSQFAFFKSIRENKTLIYKEQPISVHNVNWERQKIQFSYSNQDSKDYYYCMSFKEAIDHVLKLRLNLLREKLHSKIQRKQ